MSRHKRIGRRALFLARDLKRFKIASLITIPNRNYTQRNEASRAPRAHTRHRSGAYTCCEWFSSWGALVGPLAPCEDCGAGVSVGNVPEGRGGPIVRAAAHEYDLLNCGSRLMECPSRGDGRYTASASPPDC